MFCQILFITKGYLPVKYGYFDDVNREYIITTPQTPYPWINYLGTEQFFSLISNTAGGYCFYRDASLRRILRYRYNNIPLDMGGRYFYIHDEGKVWSPGFKPVMAELDEYSCRHGMGYTIIKGALNGLAAETLFFVPRGENCEIHRVTLENISSTKKSFKLFSFVEFCLWNASDDTTNFQRNLNTAEVEVEGSVIYHKTEYRERRNHFAFFSVNVPVDGYDTDRQSFFGPMAGFDRPAVVCDGKSRNSVADGWSPVASHGISLSMKPGEKQTLVFILGYAENPQEEKWERPGVINKSPAKRVVKKFNTTGAVDAAFNELKKYWAELLSKFSLKSSDPRLDRMVSTWNQYQCMVTFNLSRSASFFESGIGRGMGFRDSNQDLLGFVHQVPGRARERIIDLASTQFEDGGAYHQYQPLTKKGNNAVGSNFNDDPLWLILAVASYIKETGDWTILDENVPFDNNPANTASLFEHCRRSFYHVVNNLGPHALPLIGRADWNDCLNLNCYSNNPDESFQTCTNKNGRTAESLMIAGLFVFTGPLFVELCSRRGEGLLAQQARSYIDAMVQAVKTSGWDGEWFLRAYDDAGRKIGSRENSEGRIFIESQGFCSMAGIGADAGYTKKSLDAVKKYLDTQHGLVLVNPAFSRYYPNLGEVSSYPPGYKENAGVFCHNNPWIILAETMLGRGERAFEYYSKIAPAFREEISDLHRVEPYVYAQMIAGKDSNRHGEAKNSWLTGAASWNFVAVSQYILGIRPDWDGLIIDPCIPPHWDGFFVSRGFRGAEYRITVKNPKHVSKGVGSIVVDDKKISGNLLPLFSGKEVHDVVAVLGESDV